MNSKTQQKEQKASPSGIGGGGSDYSTREYLTASPLGVTKITRSCASRCCWT